MTQVTIASFKVSVSHKRPFEPKQSITNRIHRFTVVLKLQPKSRSRDEQRVEIYHSPPTTQEATMEDKIF